MKDFDALRAEREQRERTFKIAGRDFAFRAALPAQTYSLYLKLGENMNGGHWPEDSFEILNATMLQLLEEDSHEAWAEVLANGNGNPVSFDDMIAVINYCIDVQTGRPTQPRSPSGPMDESGGTKLTVASDSPAAPAPTG